VQLEFLATLEQTIAARAATGSTDSYTAALLAAGTRRIAQKVGEESVEVALAAVAGGRDEVVNEAADLLYHLLVLLHSRGLTLGDVVEALEERHKG